LTPVLVVLTLVSLQRCGELMLARRNTRCLLAQGAVEVAPGHYPAIIAVHALWLAGLWYLGRNAAIRAGWLVVFLALQLGRVWVIATLGPRWTTRIIVVPNGALIRSGPYRWISHPNYVVVASEIAVLPLAFGLPWLAFVFSVLNAAVLFVRIRAEGRALSETHARAA
jgi:methyltransferase